MSELDNVKVADIEGVIVHDPVILVLIVPVTLNDDVAVGVTLNDTEVELDIETLDVPEAVTAGVADTDDVTLHVPVTLALNVIV